MDEEDYIVPVRCDPSMTIDCSVESFRRHQSQVSNLRRRQ